MSGSSARNCRTVLTNEHEVSVLSGIGLSSILIMAGSRIREQETKVKTGSPRQYHVHRWRYIDQYSTDTDSGTISSQTHGPYASAVTFASTSRSKESIPTDTEGRDTQAWLGILVEACRIKPSPAQDHLLHLIQVNVLRGLFDNKVMLLGRTSYLAKIDGAEGLQVVPPEQVFPGRAAIISTTGGLPESCRPTLLQNTVMHATCIDLIPFPSIRDNLIKQEGRFSWAELAEDLVGHLVDPSCFFGPTCLQKKNIIEEQVLYYIDEDDPTVSRNGIIVWGPPYRPESWEVTSGFLRKWGWCLKDCEEIIESTNHWRLTRGEDPLVRSK